MVFRLLDFLWLLPRPRLFAAASRIFWAGLVSSPYREGGYARLAAARRAGLSEPELRYGETPLVVARGALSRAGLGPGGRLLDLGAGRGRVLLAARSLGAGAVGVELLDEQRAPVERALAAVGAELRAGDLLEAALDGYSHIWVTWTCLSERRRRELVEHLATVAPGVVVLTVSAPLDDDRFEPLFARTAWFTWGRAPLYASRRR